MSEYIFEMFMHNNHGDFQKLSVIVKDSILRLVFVTEDVEELCIVAVESKDILLAGS